MAEEDKSLFNISERTDTTPSVMKETGSVESLFPDLFGAQNPPEAAPSPEQPQFVTPKETASAAGEFITGLKSGWSQLGTDLRATAAMGMSLFGYEKDALDLMNIVMARQDQDEKDFPRSITRLEDVDSISDFTKWAARSLGEQIPQVASMFIGGMGTSVLGKLVGKGAMSLGMAPQIVAKFPVIFDGIGLVGTSAALETGSTAADLFQATNQLQPEASFTAGIIKGALESIVPSMLGARLGLSADITRGLSTRILDQFERLVPGRLGRTIGVGFEEGSTEALQEIVDIVARKYVDENYDWLGPDAQSRILNSAATGAFVGAVFGLAHRHNRSTSAMEERTPVMPPEFGVASPDVSVGTETTGMPAQTTLRPGEDPGSLPSLRAPLQEDQSQRLARYNPALPPSSENFLPGYSAPSDLVSSERQTTQITNNSALQQVQAFGELSPNVRRLDGQAYSLETHKPGTAVMLNNSERTLTPEEQTFGKRITDWMNQEMRRIGMKDQKLVVFFDSLADQKQVMNTNMFQVEEGNGFYGGWEGGIGVIGLAKQSTTKLEGIQSDQTLVWSTAVHEFGHFIVHRRFAEATPDVQRQILKDYQDALVRLGYGDLRYAGPFMHPKRILYMTEGQPEHLFSRNGPERIPNTEYFLSFDEYMAEQIAKYYSAETMRKTYPLGAWTKAQQFFRNMAQELRVLFDRAKIFFHLETAPSVRDWMDSIRNAKSSITQMALREGDLRETAANTQVLSPVSNGEAIPGSSSGSGGIVRMMKRLGLPGGKEIKAFADKFDWFMNLFLNIQQIGFHNPHIKPLQRYLELTDQWYNFQMNWMGRADQRIREWGALGTVQQKNLAQFLFAVDAMEYLTPQERAAGTLRLPTEAELRGLVTKYRLNEASFQQYRRIKEDFDAVLDQIEATSRRDIDRMITDPITKVRELSELEREMHQLRSRPYFPHARFGDWAVVIKDKKGGKTVHMEQFESQRQANAAAVDILAEVKKQYPEAVGIADYIPREVTGFRGLPPNLIARIKERLKLSDVQNEWLDNLIVEMAPSVSFRHHLQRRMNTPGFSFNAQRAYASYFFHGARHLARIEYGPLMQEEVSTGMNQSIQGLQEQGIVVNVRARRRIQEYMANHLEHILNPKPDWHQLRSATFLWFLGFNPSSAMLNLTQPVLVGYPYLAARFGDVKAVKAMMKATRDIQSMYKYKDTDRVSDALFKAIDRAMKEGVVDESQAAELSASAQGGYLAKLLPGTKLQRLAQQFAHYGSWMFQQSEKLNRRVMFRAAWELAMKAETDSKYMADLEATNHLAMSDMLSKGFDRLEARAYLAAKDAVNQTQFRYGQHARPKFMRGKAGVVFTFFMFTQSMLHFARYSPGNVRYLAMMLLMAGLMGLPGAEDLEAIAKLIARNFLGKDFDLQREVRELVVGMLGDAIPPDLFLHGAGRVGFGLPAMMDLLGLPKAQFDFSRRIGFGRIIPGLADLGAPGVDFDQAMSRVSQQASGATFGLGFNIIKALSDDALPANDFKRWERMMPTSLANLSKVLRYAIEGRERSRTDATIVDYNITDPDHIAELALRGLGFQPTRVQREWDRIQMQREAEAYWMGRRAIILKLWNHSFGIGDSNLRETALTDVRQYNAEVPFGSMKITGTQLAKSRKEHLRQTRIREAGLTSQKALRPLAREIGSLHPETQQTQIVDVEDMSRVQ